MKNLNKILTCLFVGFGILTSNAQVTNTGLPVSIGSGLQVYIPTTFEQSGTLVNEGTLEVEGDLSLLGAYTGNGVVEASGTTQNLDFQASTVSTLNITGGDKTLLSHLVVNDINLSSARLITNDQDFEVTGNISGVDASSHIVGRLIRSGTDPIFFPIANATNQVYAPITISSVVGTDPKISVESFETNPLGIAGNGLLDVSNERYWELDQVSGVFESAVVELPVIVEQLSGQIEDLVIAKGSNVSGSFHSLGSSSFSGDLTSGSVSSATPSGAGLYTLGLFFDETLRVNDSTALVAIYEKAGGENWLNDSGWLSESLDTWSGVTVSDKRVTALNLSGNNLIDTIPQINEGLESLTDLNIRSNELRSIPDLTRLSALTNFEVTNNRLEFGSLEPNVGISGIAYSPQGLVGLEKEELFETGQSYEISREISGSTNTYAWFKEDKDANVTSVDSDGSSAITIPINEFDDEGFYFARVTNPLVSGLELTTEKLFVKVSSLQRDQTVLMELFDATGGSNWTTNTSWGTGTVSSAWHGVTVDNDRVTRVELPENGLDGEVPASMADIAGLTDLDLSRNELVSFPDVSSISGLQDLDLSGNKLLFGSLVPNLPVITGGGTFDYSDQKRFGQTEYDTLDAGGNRTLADFENIDFGDDQVAFQWKFGPLKPGEPFNNDVADITDANAQTYEITGINFDSQGTYRLVASHPDIPDEDFVIESRNQNILASTDFLGTINLDGAAVSDAEVVVWRQTPTGPFVKEDSAFVNNSGEYLLEDVVLGNFVVVAKPNRDLEEYENTIQTYYISEETYSEANIVELREPTQGIDIDLISFEPEVEIGTGTIGGFMESDFDDEIVDEETGARITSRRKVRKAGCSMRRFKSQGRLGENLQDDVEEEIAYYVETDDEGFFNFSEVADGKYLLNIEFPGVPVSENAEVVFEIGGDRENQVFDVNVLITEEGIEVDQEEILYNLKPYVKNIKLYPNPTDGIMAMDYLVYRSIDDLKLQLVSTGGVILEEHVIDHWMGNQHTTIDLRDYGVGIYYLVFTDEAGTFSNSIKIGRK
ncbi:MAG: hypothetical protein JXR03_14000 [Cyclobacteriaceae bacterium]